MKKIIVTVLAGLAVAAGTFHAVGEADAWGQYDKAWGEADAWGQYDKGGAY